MGWVGERERTSSGWCYRAVCDDGAVAAEIVPPSGTVTFLFTDVEGSTRLWEEHPEAMRVALGRHDEIVRSAIEAHDGYVFSTAGDAFAAAFSRAGDAADAAVEAQRSLGVEQWPSEVSIRVRMGLHTGEAEERGGDYFGPALNRAARLMSAGWGRQVLLTGVTAALVDAELRDLGAYRLKDLGEPEQVSQVVAEGLQVDFEALRTLDAIPGNLPIQVTSFVGRQDEVSDLRSLGLAHRLVTLTGVGGVGKTRLSLQVAAEMSGEFEDGVWLVELAPVGDPDAVGDAVANTLGVTHQGALSVADGIAGALAGRRVLLVLDNCEHVIDAAAGLVETLVTSTEGVHVLATSREGLQIGGEQLWPVAPLPAGRGDSAAEELFIERVLEANPSFDPDPDAVEAISEICQRVDGIALAIELAAARMVSMSAQDIRDRLDDRFRLLAGSRRGLERHKTLRQTVAWSYDLLDPVERGLLERCCVFAGGFDHDAAVTVCGDEKLDEFAVLDALDSLVRKSLVTVEHVAGHARYGLLETIRQFGDEQLTARGSIDELRNSHVVYFASQAADHWELWNGPGQPKALEWVELEYANLRAAFRWVEDRDLATAAAIAVHTTMLSVALQRYEPAGWAEELIPAAIDAALPELAHLYAAAAHCLYTGRPEDAARYGRSAIDISPDTETGPIISLARVLESTAHGFSGRLDTMIEHATQAATRPGFDGEVGRMLQLFAMSAAGRHREAAEFAEDVLAAARSEGNPFWTAMALGGCGRVFINIDPDRAFGYLREGIEYCDQNRILYWGSLLSRDTAGVEVAHGDLSKALDLLQTTLDGFQRASASTHVALTLGFVAMFFERLGEPHTAARIYGAANQHGSAAFALGLPDVVQRLQDELGKAAFEHAVAQGAADGLTTTADYAKVQLRAAHQQLDTLDSPQRDQQR